MILTPPAATVVPRFDVITLFEPMFEALTAHGITGRAGQRALYTLKAWNPRTFTRDAHRTVDDRPYGGGPGMVMLAEPLLHTVAAIQQEAPVSALIVLSPQGERVDQRVLLELAQLPAITFICGRYEAIDQRALDILQPRELSIGDFVVSGGELPAMLILDALIRRLPGAVNTSDSIKQDSFENGLLDCPHYSRPEQLFSDAGVAGVPPVLLSGHHERIDQWRREQSLKITLQRRPDLIDHAFARLTTGDRAYLMGLGYNRRLSSSD